MSINHREATGIFQSLAGTAILDVLPKVSRLELRVAIDICDGSHRIAKHLAIDRAFKKFVLGYRGEKVGDRSFQPVNFALRNVGDSEGVPVDLFQPFRRQSFFGHPCHQLLIRVTARSAAVDDEIDPAIFARPHHAHLRSQNTAAGHEHAGALRVHAIQIPECRRMGQRRHHRDLRGDVHLLA